MSEDVVKVEDLLNVFRRYLALFIVLSVSGAILAGIAAKTLPKKFKSKGVISIQSSYFENPLVSDLVPEVHDFSELSARRAALLRLALTESFVDQLGEEYHFYNSPAASKERVRERELLLTKISFFSMSPNTYHVSVVWDDAEASFAITRRVVDQMISTLLDQRYALLLNTKNAIKSHVESLGLTLRDISGPAASLDPQGLRSQLDKVNKDLEALLVNYTEKHPEVLKLKEQALALENLLVNRSDEVNSSESSPGFLPPNAALPIQEVYNELLKKLNYLNIILEIESDRDKVSHLAVIEQPALPTSAFFPNTKLFLAVGAAIGCFLALVFVILREMRRGAFVSVENFSARLDVPFFGVLPPLESSPQVRLLDGPIGNALQRALPWQRAREG